MTHDEAMKLAHKLVSFQYAYPAMERDGRKLAQFILSDLIAKLQAAKEGSRELDAEIYCAVTPSRFIFSNDGMHSDHPAYTTSLDAALTLVPERLTAAIMVSRIEGSRAICRHDRHIPKEKRPVSLADAPTPALALCIASLRAREVRR